MEILTFNSILTMMCDEFDALISPKTITRSNTNIIYLMFKAMAKGYEIIHNVVYALSKKFDPRYCSDEELESTAFLVGTEKLKGSVTGLEILAINNGTSAVTLKADTYSYMLDADTTFKFTVREDTSIAVGGSASFIALTEKIGSYPVTSQSSISVESETEPLDSKISFACTDNKALLGASEESTLAFRKRILGDVTRQDTISELEIAIKNLPFIFDCSVKFNESSEDVTVGDITVPPYHLLLLISGEPRAEIAEVIASKGIYPTVIVDSDDYVEYENDVFTSGGYKVYYKLFDIYDYDVNVLFKANEDIISSEIAEEKMRAHLLASLNGNTRKAVITENDVYNSFEDLALDGVTIYSVELYVNSNRVQYVSVPPTDIAHIETVTFSEVS